MLLHALKRFGNFFLDQADIGVATTAELLKNSGILVRATPQRRTNVRLRTLPNKISLLVHNLVVVYCDVALLDSSLRFT